VKNEVERMSWFAVKKWTSFLVLVLLTTILVSCDKKEYMGFEELDGGSKLKCGDTVYVFYGALPDKSLLGKQIGVVNNDKKHKVFEGVSNLKNFKICLDKGEHCRQLRKT
jgi:hypothetical protein